MNLDQQLESLRQERDSLDAKLRAVRAALSCEAGQDAETRARNLWHDYQDALRRIATLSGELVDAKFAASGWQEKAESPTIERCVSTLSKALQECPEFAVAWQSNIAMPILDGCKRRVVVMDHETANQLADDLMLHLFGVKRTAQSL